MSAATFLDTGYTAVSKDNGGAYGSLMGSGRLTMTGATVGGFRITVDVPIGE